MELIGIGIGVGILAAIGGVCYLGVKFVKYLVTGPTLRDRHTHRPYTPDIDHHHEIPQMHDFRG